MNQKDSSESNVGKCLVSSYESHRKEGEKDFSDTNTHFASSPGPSPVCYSPGSPTPILEDPNYFFPDFQLYSGRREASALTVEANGGIREKVGKSFYWHLVWKNKMIICFWFLAFLQIFPSILALTDQPVVLLIVSLLVGAFLKMFLQWRR